LIQSKALEANIIESYREVTINPKYSVIQEVLSKYYGLTEGLNIFLREISHPFKNWQFIIKEARVYSLDYLHLLKNHPKGPEAAKLFADIFATGIVLARDMDDRTDAVDNLLLFLQKIIKESGKELTRFIPVLDDSFNRIRNYEDEYFMLFVRSFYQIKKLAELLSEHCERLNVHCQSFKEINLLLIKYFRYSYAYWLKEENPQRWFEEEASEIINISQSLNGIFREVSHEQIKKYVNLLDQIIQDNTESLETDNIIKSMEELPGYNQIADIYREIPQKLFKAGGEGGRGNQWKLLFLFHIMNVSGLSMIHEETLREINRVLTWLMGHEHYWNINKLIEQTFSILKERTSKFPGTALSCVLNMGKGVYKTDEIDLINLFIDSMADLGFQTPMIGGVGNDWQIKANILHIQNIRTWLEIIELKPKCSTRLLSALIIHLSLCGVFIKDTDLFPRDITRLLNSNIKPVYNLVKQMAKLFPVYFNDIGAEGRLRDISTQIDEISHRRDVLVHFLRKQSHVESNNRIISFMEGVLKFWETKDKKIIEPFLPPNIYRQIRTDGDYIAGIHKAIMHLKNKGMKLPDDLLKIPDAEVPNLFESLSGEVSDDDRKRAELAIVFYKLLYQKYRLEFIEMDHYLSQLKNEAFPDVDKLKEALAESDLKRKIIKLLDYLERLKGLILSDEVYEIREDIYKKRHFTVDIPSMYGSYHEMKFDALGLTFRIESLLNVLFEELIENIDLSLITKATFYQIYSRLRLFDRALKLDGISSSEMERQLEFLAQSLEVKGFSFTQYVDIFKGFVQAVSNVINDYFNNIHQENLTRILSQISSSQILSKYLPGEETDTNEKLRHRVSEVFSRERIATSLGLQQLDRFLTRILNILYNQAERLPKEKLHQLLLYDPDNVIMCVNRAGGRVFGIIYLGNKGFNLVKLRDLGLPIPPGFIITTEGFHFRDMIYTYPPAEHNFREQIMRHISEIERITGKVFGDPSNPLLFSVRSGSSISQPGMMDTLLDVGMNEEIAAGLAEKSGNPWFAWDNYRRFLQCYGMSYGMERDAFDAAIGDFKKRCGVIYKRDLPPAEMRKAALAYKQMIHDFKVDIVEDPVEQLHMTIKRVFSSWDSPKARTYRKIMGISDDWGTAVTVQAMVFGNLSRHSGTGVFFTHNPRWYGSELRLWGDFTMGNQGEDVVAGLVNTLPISVNQQEIEKRQTDITLETHFPEIYKTLKNWSGYLIEKEGWGPQEIEFTFESPLPKDLYLLQTRDMSIREHCKVLTFEFDEESSDNILGHGIGVSGGAMVGRVVFDVDEIEKWRTVEPNTKLILLRADTVPDDIREIYAADGLLTARGGLTSHAAVVAHRLGKTCVVGCGNMICDQHEKRGVFGKLILNPGDYISIDGREGSVYQGLINVKAE